MNIEPNPRREAYRVDPRATVLEGYKRGERQETDRFASPVENGLGRIITKRLGMQSDQVVRRAVAPRR